MDSELVAYPSPPSTPPPPPLPPLPPLPSFPPLQTVHPTPILHLLPPLFESAALPPQIPPEPERNLQIYGVLIRIHHSIKLDWARSAIVYLVESGRVEFNIVNGMPYVLFRTISIMPDYATPSQFNNDKNRELHKLMITNRIDCDSFHYAYSVNGKFKTIKLDGCARQIIARFDTVMSELVRKIVYLHDLICVVSPSPLSICGLAILYRMELYPISYTPSKDSHYLNRTYSIEEAIEIIYNIQTTA